MKDQIDLSKMETVLNRVPNGYERLQRYWREPTCQMWDEIWSKTEGKEYWKNALNGELLYDYKKVFEKYLQPGSKILEAGCGLGQVVLALRKRGFNCYGLDYADKVINILKNNFPNVPFDIGDIRNMNYKDNSFDSYISLGVIEHFIEGQEVILKEAARVLNENGIIFLSVPFYSPFRKLLNKFGKYKKDNFLSELPYFEACFSKEELQFLFNNSGFDIVDYVYINPIMPFVQETFLRPLYFFVEDKIKIRGLIDRVLKTLLPKKIFSHMIMIVARIKPS
jgi:ubiquinone/menaquinone biosynthesis C-methylase UbiE